MNRGDRWKQLVAAETARRAEQKKAGNGQAREPGKEPTARRALSSNPQHSVVVRCRELVSRYPGKSLVATLSILVVCVLIVLALRVPAGHGMMVPVSGVVTLDGEPIANIQVLFQPTSGTAADPIFSPGSHGTTNAEGRYKLKWSDGSGAIYGEHVVTLMYKDPNKMSPEDFINEDGSEEPLVFRLPKNARDGSIRFTVPKGGTDQADFAFRSEPNGES